MGDLLSALGRLVSRRNAQEAAGIGLIPTRSAGWSTWAGVTVTERTALQQATVYACVSIIADSIAMLPVDAYRGDGPSRQALGDKPQILTEPAPGLRFDEWISQGLVSRLLRGNFYALVAGRDGLGYPTELLPLAPDGVSLTRDTEGRIEYVIAGYDTVPASEVFHVRGLTLPGSRVGLSVIEYARQTFGVAIGADEFAARLFGEGGQPAGVLKTDANIEQELAAEIQERWLAAHGGRSRKPAVLGAGLEWQPISLSPEEAQFLETRKFLRSEIAGLFRVPPHMVADVERSTSWGTGIEEQALGYVTYTLGPHITAFERALSAILPKPQYVKFNTNALLRGRALDRANFYARGRADGWLNPDEIREKEDMPPLPDGAGQTYLAAPPGAPVAGQAAGGQAEVVEAAAGGMSATELATALQKIYLAVGKVITADEAREILNREGAGLVGSFETPTVTPAAESLP